MPKYLVKCKASVYHDVEVEADDELHARDLGETALADLISDVKLPDPLEWESVEMWEVEEVNAQLV